MGRKLLKTVQTITTFRNQFEAPVGTRRGPPLVRGPQFENRWLNSVQWCSQECELEHQLVKFDFAADLTGTDNRSEEVMK